MNINWIANKNINKKKVNELLNINIKTNQFTNAGPNVKLLEDIIRDKLKINENKSIIAVCNGSVAIHSLVSSINFYHNKELIWATQAFTFPPSAQGVLKNAVILDIDDEYGLDLLEIEKYEKENSIQINGIIVTNIFGNLVNIEKYEKYCNKNNKILIFDNAATPYSMYKNKNSCNYGLGSTISFHHTKPIGFGEGGAIIVDKKYEEIIRKMNNFGIGLCKDAYYFNGGNNYKMSEISAVYIIQYLENFEKIKNKHIKLYKYFSKKVKNNKNFKLFVNYSDNNLSLISCFTLVYNNNNNNFDDNDYNVLELLQKNNILCRKYYVPLVKKENSTKLYNNILCIPCNLDLNNKKINIILDIINI